MYVYGVVRAGERLALPASGVDGRPVGCLRHGALAALVGEAPGDPVRPSRRNVMAHTAVLQDVVAAGADVLPMQFGVVMPDGDAVRDELLVAHGEALAAQLDALSGRVELDVTVTEPQAALLREVIASDPRLEAATQRLRAAGSSASYQQRIEVGEADARAVEAERHLRATEVVERLGPHVVDAVVSEPRHEDMLANVAFLVERARRPAFDAALEQLGALFGDETRVRCVGPLPAYRFVELVLEPEAGTWA